MAKVTGRTFGSDNHAGVHPTVMAAIQAANVGDAVAYGDDEVTRAALRRICAVSGARQAYLVFNGTAANVVSLSLMMHPYEAVICAETSHLNTDECGAPERILGAKLLTVPAPDGKLTPALAATRLGGRGDEHHNQPRVLQVAQVTELGTCYTLAELAELRDFAHDRNLLVYLDGARIANAAAHLGCSLADIAACADVLSFGGTKNGALGVEAILVMREDLAVGARYQRKQLMQLASKMRFLGAQVDALLTDDLWLANARQANAMAQLLRAGLTELPGVSVAYPVEANGVFAEIDRSVAERLQESLSFHIWRDLPGGRCVVRWMTAFDTTEDDVNGLLAAAAEATQAERLSFT